MNKCPQEIYDHIVSYVKDRPTIAAVSRMFQVTVERHTFRQLSIKTTERELREFERTLTPRRLNTLRCFDLTVIVPSYFENKFETDEDRIINNEAATAVLGRVFCVLARRGHQNDNITPMLDLKIWSEDIDMPRRVKRKTPGPCAFSLLDLTSDASTFPNVPCVRSFFIGNGYGRQWNPHVATTLSAKMVKAIQVEWNLSFFRMESNHYPSLDRMFRDGLLENIKSTKLPASVEKFSCTLQPPNTISHHQPPRFFTPGDSDPVSCALRHLTRNCTNIRINSPIDLSLFGPPAGSLLPCWQNTTDLNVIANMGSPDGRWLFDFEDRWISEDADYSPPDIHKPPPGYGATLREKKQLRCTIMFLTISKQRVVAEMGQRTRE